jgi:flavodoxin
MEGDTLADSGSNDGEPGISVEMIKWIPTMVAMAMATMAVTMWNKAKRIKEENERKNENYDDVYNYLRTQTEPKETKARTKVEEVEGCCQGKEANGNGGGGGCKETQKNGIKILYGTQMGNAETFANKLKAMAEAAGVHVSDVTNVKDCEAEETLANASATVALIISTYVDGEAPPDAKWFCTWLKEAANDFRYQHSMLKGLKFAVFGLGHSDYKDHYCLAARDADKHLVALSAKRIHVLGLGDEAQVKTKAGSWEADFEVWCNALIKKVKGDDKEGGCCEDVEDDEGLEEDEDDSSDEAEVSDDGEEENGGLVDLEDLGKIKEMKISAEADKKTVKSMITPNLRKSLEKQGYKLIGEIMSNFRAC